MRLSKNTLPKRNMHYFLKLNKDFIKLINRRIPVRKISQKESRNIIKIPKIDPKADKGRAGPTYANIVECNISNKKNDVIVIIV